MAMNFCIKIFFALFLFAFGVKAQTDTSFNCDFCKQKRSEYFALKNKLKVRVDSLQKIIDYHNTYIKDGYCYNLNIGKYSSFLWEGCHRPVYRAQDKFLDKYIIIYGCTYSSGHEVDDITDGDFTIKKEQFFNMRLDGLTGEHRFYQEDLR